MRYIPPLFNAHIKDVVNLSKFKFQNADYDWEK